MLRSPLYRTCIRAILPGRSTPPLWRKSAVPMIRPINNRVCKFLDLGIGSRINSDVVFAVPAECSDGLSFFSLWLSAFVDPEGDMLARHQQVKGYQSIRKKNHRDPIPQLLRSCHIYCGTRSRQSTFCLFQIEVYSTDEASRSIRRALGLIDRSTVLRFPAS